MPRTLTQRQDMANAIVPPSLISYQAIAQTDRHAITRSCEHTTLITRAQAPYYKNRDLNLTHKNTVASDDICYHVPDTSFQYLNENIAIQWPFLQILRNLTTCAIQFGSFTKMCQHILVNEPNCTNIDWIYFLHDTRVMEIRKPS